MRGFTAISFLTFFLAANLLFADFEQEIRSQVQALVAQYSAVALDALYFKQMGILARKADDIESNELLTEIVKTHLFQKMDQFVEVELEGIHTLYLADAVLASKKYTDLATYDKVFQPTQEFLNTTPGQALAAELVRYRGNALQTAQRTCQDFALRELIQVYRKTGHFETNRSEEIASVREMKAMLDCCMNWRSEILYQFQRGFFNDYEAGVIRETGVLRLQSDRRDKNHARWAGDWIYQFDGREGNAEGKSQAILTYDKGQETATLTITHARVVSEGRINFPLSPAGELRTLEVEGKNYVPEVLFNKEQMIAVTGCNKDK